MRTHGAADPAAGALAQREDDHQRWADDGGSSPDVARPEAAVPADRTGLPVRLVYRRRPAA